VIWYLNYASPSLRIGHRVTGPDWYSYPNWYWKSGDAGQRFLSTTVGDWHYLPACNIGLWMQRVLPEIPLPIEHRLWSGQVYFIHIGDDIGLVTKESSFWIWISNCWVVRAWPSWLAITCLLLMTFSSKIISKALSRNGSVANIRSSTAYEA